MLSVLQRSLTLILLLASQVSGALVVSAENPGFAVEVTTNAELQLEHNFPSHPQQPFFSSAPPPAPELQKIISAIQLYPISLNEFKEQPQVSPLIEPCQSSHTPTPRCTQGPPSRL